jgi:hypothetical protein
MAKARAVPFVDPDASLFVHAAVSIGTRIDELISFEPYLADAKSVYELHQMRIAAKRLRYTMDLFQSAFDDFSRYGKEFAAAVSEVKLLQEHLGNIHDADVLAPKLTAQLRKILESGHGKDKHGEPIVGVHLVDFDACQGLLSLCVQTRNDRDASFELLKHDWSRMVEATLFDQWRKLLRKAITDETLAAVLHEPLPSGATLEDSAEMRSAAETAPITNDAQIPIAPESVPPAHDNEVEAAKTAETVPHAPENRDGEAVNEKPRESRNGKTSRPRVGRKAAGADA